MEQEGTEMIDSEKVIKGLERFKEDFRPYVGNQADWDRFDQAFVLISRQAKELSELRETLTEMSMNGGTGNQHDVCKFLLNLMDVIEKKYHECGRPGDWRVDDD